MNEGETRAELIDLALNAAGWGIIKGNRIRGEVIALGRLVCNSKRGQTEIANQITKVTQ
jgi:type I restriction enzyme R subunit